jgi:hypothetical protein
MVVRLGAICAVAVNCATAGTIFSGPARVTAAGRRIITIGTICLNPYATTGSGYIQAFTDKGVAEFAGLGTPLAFVWYSDDEGLQPLSLTQTWELFARRQQSR